MVSGLILQNLLFMLLNTAKSAEYVCILHSLVERKRRLALKTGKKNKGKKTSKCMNRL